MTPFVPALAGGLVAAGGVGLVVGLRRTVRTPGPPLRSLPVVRMALGLLGRVGVRSRRQRQVVALAFAAGAVVALVTGWFVAVLAVPGVVVALPALIAAPASKAQVGKLEAMEEWTRSLAGVLTVGSGLEQALTATVRSAPAPIRPHVARLASRLRARWRTEDAIRAFADDLDDITGDLIAGNLILASRRRGPGLASVLESLAGSVAEDVRARREVETERAKPRATARWITVITVCVLVVLAFTGEYVQPYGTALGQVFIMIYLALYVAALIWMRSMTAGTVPARFIGQDAKGTAR